MMTVVFSLQSESVSDCVFRCLVGQNWDPHACLASMTELKEVVLLTTSHGILLALWLAEVMFQKYKPKIQAAVTNAVC